ncbi:Response regulator receiver domain-containing protein [Reichenbachiella faecimaris]|uniref:Response regulator receiver domain-containing protein n=1 Tax=Reichenbachiella faecimaris TaxID=692418 RepID=A0A1W2G8T2_REIFA|nr:response regulator [Reichenbachiella faecimaris]SMD33100.1 Response regulator receiver domain-containing protein [Reichenbachiella faecimaris]
MKSVKSIYVVEDDPISSFVIKLALQQHPAFDEAVEFKNGQVAVDHLLKNEANGNLPELILLDINMPVMDGWDFLDKFSEMGVSKDIPVVMLTSSINPNDIEKANAHELVKGFLSKPLNKEKLDEVLRLV